MRGGKRQGWREEANDGKAEAGGVRGDAPEGRQRGRDPAAVWAPPERPPADRDVGGTGRPDGA
ncbi:hypothetical protein MNV_2170004 [Candidatus Methanoperedens nitroreducens]|uniref:Uncharacterized protein n=1 Tax=Candidatus Methanoperedens nitratireducens TaxID=1392998 RepID=A0A284VP34_9EURY|nr:hypothetical protein MNV_2170004 [Candidatus Methanoperedens nitroreducens]